MQINAHWNYNGKKAGRAEQRGRLCCLYPVDEVQALKQCFSCLQTPATKGRCEIKGIGRAGLSFQSLMTVFTPKRCSSGGGKFVSRAVFSTAAHEVALPPSLFSGTKFC